MKKSILNFLIIATSIIGLFFSPRISAQWSTIGNGGNTNGFVVDFIEHNGYLWASGFFTEIDGVAANYVARWDGEKWEQAGSGLSDAGHNFFLYQGLLAVAKYETDGTEMTCIYGTAQIGLPSIIRSL